jgi:hypothetical protein
MVFKRDDKGRGWHEPPYTEAEEREFYRRYNAGFESGKPSNNDDQTTPRRSPVAQRKVSPVDVEW